MLTILPFLFAVQSEPAPSSPPTISHNLFGACVDAAGDMDGDGVPDLWVGDPSHFRPGGAGFGKVWCVSGQDGSTLLRIDAPTGAEEFGWTVAGIGDVDADGVRDVAVGCLFVGTPGTQSPSRWGKKESTDGESAVHAFSGRDGALRYAIRGAAECAKVGWCSTAAGPALTSVGDWNEDGADDLAIGWSFADADAQDQGRVQVVSGRDGSTVHSWTGLEAHDRFGFSLTRLTDLDGDGKAELAAGAVPAWDPSSEASDFLRRTRSGYVRILSSKGTVLRSLHPYDGSRCFGFSLAALPRKSPRSATELLVAQPHDRNAEVCITSWNLADGSATQFITKPPIDVWDGGWERAHTKPAPDSVDESFGTRILAVPDRDGDGEADILVTVPQAFCFVPAGVLSSKRPSWRDAIEPVGVPIGRVTLESVPEEYSHVGIGLAAIGDVNGDNVDDFAISGASIRYGGACGTVSVVSGRTLNVLRYFTRAGRE